MINSLGIDRLCIRYLCVAQASSLNGDRIGQIITSIALLSLFDIILYEVVHSTRSTNAISRLVNTSLDLLLSIL